MINRQKLIEELLEEHCGYGDSNCERCVFDCLIRNVVEALSQPPADQWIPCSERLPEEDGKFLVTNETGGVEIATFHKNTVAGDVFSNRHSRRRNAWMPLPEPYKGVW